MTAAVAHEMTVTGGDATVEVDRDFPDMLMVRWRGLPSIPEVHFIPQSDGTVRMFVYGDVDIVDKTRNRT